MAFAFVQGTTGDSGVTPLTSTAFASAITVGNIIVVNVSGDGGATGLVSSVTDSAGNTYSHVASLDHANAGGTLNSEVWWADVTTGGSGVTISVAFNDAAENCNITAQEFSGFTGTPTVDQGAVAEGTSTTPSSGASGTTAQANELVIGYAVHGGTVSAFSLGAGYTNLTQNSVANRQTAMESKAVSSVGAQTATFTIALSRAWICTVITFYDAGAPAAATTVSSTLQLLTGVGM